MTNKYQEHLWVLPEDDANRQLVNGFRTSLDLDDRRIQVLPPARGWENVLGAMKRYQSDLATCPHRHLLLMIDFDTKVDDRAKRFLELRSELPPGVQDRVYLLGSRGTPEQLRKALEMSFERIGAKLAADCPPDAAAGIWQHADLRHNANELARLVAKVRPFLFKRGATVAPQTSTLALKVAT